MQHNAAWVSAPGPHTAFSPLSYPLILCQNRLTARFYLVSCALAAAQAPEARPDVTKRHLRQHGGSGRCRAILLRRRHQLAREPRETREIGNQAAERLCRLHHQCRPAPDAVVSAVLSARAAGLALAPERVAIRDAARTQTTRRPLGHTSVSPRPSRVGAGATIKLERKHGRLRGRACRWRAGRTNATASLATRDCMHAAHDALGQASPPRPSQSWPRALRRSLRGALRPQPRHSRPREHAGNLASGLQAAYSGLYKIQVSGLINDLTGGRTICARGSSCSAVPHVLQRSSCVSAFLPCHKGAARTRGVGRLGSLRTTRRRPW